MTHSYGFGIICIVFALLSNGVSAQMQVRHIYRGSVVVDNVLDFSVPSTASMQSVTVDVPTFDGAAAGANAQSHLLLTFSYDVLCLDPSVYFIAGEVLPVGSNDAMYKIGFARGKSAALIKDQCSVTVYWQLIDFASGVTVQHLGVDDKQASGTLPVTIANPTSTFLISTVAQSSNWKELKTLREIAYALKDAYISGNSIVYKMGNAAFVNDVGSTPHSRYRFQVVQWNGAFVRRGSLMMDRDNMEEVVVNPVSMSLAEAANSFLLFSWGLNRVSGGLNGGTLGTEVDSSVWGLYEASTGKVHFKRTNAMQDCQTRKRINACYYMGDLECLGLMISYELVTLPDDFPIRTQRVTFKDYMLSRQATPLPVEVSEPWLLVGGQSGLSSLLVCDDIMSASPPVASSVFSVYVKDGMTVAQRSQINHKYDATSEYYIIDVGYGSASPPTPVPPTQSVGTMDTVVVTSTKSAAAMGMSTEKETETETTVSVTPDKNDASQTPEAAGDDMVLIIAIVGAVLLLLCAMLLLAVFLLRGRGSASGPRDREMRSRRGTQRGLSRPRTQRRFQSSQGSRKASQRRLDTTYSQVPVPVAQQYVQGPLASSPTYDTVSGQPYSQYGAAPQQYGGVQQPYGPIGAGAFATESEFGRIR